MDFDLENKLSNLIKTGKLSDAIAVAEGEFKNLEKTDFQQISGRNLLHQTENLLEFIQIFSDKAAEFYENQGKGFFKSLFSKAKPSMPRHKALYSEMNAFTINPDRWFLDLFAFSQVGDREDLDWLSDFDYATENSFTIEGFEDIQEVYAVYMKNQMWEIEMQKRASNVCELLIILRLQELFHAVFEKANIQKRPWAQIPTFITAHDYELILELPMP